MCAKWTLVQKVQKVCKARRKSIPAKRYFGHYSLRKERTPRLMHVCSGPLHNPMIKPLILDQGCI